MIWTDNLDPVALNLGFAQIRWYGILYVIAFLLGYIWLVKTAKNFSRKQIDDLVFALILGVILGGRIGYFLLYDPGQIFSLQIFKIWEGGMSFHGGLIGIFLAILWLMRRWGKSFLEISDLIVIPAALGLFFGRIGNFINGELVGRAIHSTSSGQALEWGVIFPHFDATPRYPSQLFEAAKNLGIAGILFLILRQKPRPGVLSFSFLILYGLGRTAVELLWREPLDGFIFDIPKGAAYSIPVFLIGLIGLIFIIAKRERRE
ncbi:MAG: prolipoprotein diacylglyceryl transferase [Patescibacteria group bacterium]